MEIRNANGEDIDCECYDIIEPRMRRNTHKSEIHIYRGGDIDRWYTFALVDTKDKGMVMMREDSQPKDSFSYPKFYKEDEEA